MGLVLLWDTEDLNTLPGVDLIYKMCQRRQHAVTNLFERATVRLALESMLKVKTTDWGNYLAGES